MASLFALPDLRSVSTSHIDPADTSTPLVTLPPHITDFGLTLGTRSFYKSRKKVVEKYRLKERKRKRKREEEGEKEKAGKRDLDCLTENYRG